jgi:hypothetical protein
MLTESNATFDNFEDIYIGIEPTVKKLVRYYWSITYTESIHEKGFPERLSWLEG